MPQPLALVGALYFPAIVDKASEGALGSEARELPKPEPIFIAGPLIASLLVVITTAILLRSLAIDTIFPGAPTSTPTPQHGFWESPPN